MARDTSSRRTDAARRMLKAVMSIVLPSFWTMSWRMKNARSRDWVDSAMVLVRMFRCES